MAAKQKKPTQRKPTAADLKALRALDRYENRVFAEVDKLLDDPDVTEERRRAVRHFVDEARELS